GGHDKLTPREGSLRQQTPHLFVHHFLLCPVPHHTLPPLLSQGARTLTAQTGERTIIQSSDPQEKRKELWRLHRPAPPSNRTSLAMRNFSIGVMKTPWQNG